MADSADLLFELGTEELPPTALKRLMQAFEKGFLEGLDNAGLSHGNCRAFATPRRLALMALLIGRTHQLSISEGMRIIQHLKALQEMIEEFLTQNDAIRELAQDYLGYADFLFLGRNLNYPIAMEGALKLKEISYIHAEGYPAAEMKHGPIALIDKHMPVVVMAPRDGLFDKTVSNLREVAARGGRILLISSDQGVEALGDGLGLAGQVDDQGVAPDPGSLPGSFLHLDMLQ